jgi:hypothetical protein
MQDVSALGSASQDGQVSKPKEASRRDSIARSSVGGLDNYQFRR